MGAVVALIASGWTCNPRLWVRISAPAGIVHDWGETLEQGTEPATAPRTPLCQLPTAPGVCALEWVKCREHISLLVILCIIVYVTNKAHLSLIIIIDFFRKQKWVCSQEIQVRDGRKEQDNRKDVEAFRSICGMNKGWEEQHLDAEDKTSRHNFVNILISENSDI